MTFYVGILLKIALLAISSILLKDYQSHQGLKNKVPGQGRRYDYIIVGGGDYFNSISYILRNMLLCADIHSKFDNEFNRYRRFRYRWAFV